MFRAGGLQVAASAIHTRKENNMAYKYTTEGCFTGELLKTPPLPEDNQHVKNMRRNLEGLRRRWLKNGCAVEEIGRFGYMNMDHKASLSALVYHVQDVLKNPQPIDNADGYGPAAVVKGVKLYAARFVIAVLTDEQLASGIGKVLEDYLGFKQLAPFFGNTAKTYGMNSRIGLYGVCCTRYLDKEHQSNGEIKG